MESFGQGQNLRQSARQDMLMLPRMLQSIEVLHLPILELSSYLREAFEGNEALSLEEPVQSTGEDWDAPVGRRGTSEDSERHDEMLRNQPEPDRSLADLIEDQLALLEVSKERGSWVRLLVGCLDSNGYLSTSDEQLLVLAEEAGLTADESELSCAVAILQTFEPRGIGGRNAVEALLLQLEPEDPDYGLLCALLEDFLTEITTNKLPGVAKSMGIDLPRLEELLASLQGLNPSPVAIHVGDAAPPIHPEVIVELDGIGFRVRVDQSGLPAIHVDPDVQAIAADKAQTNEVRTYLRGKIDQARSLVRAVEQRRETLLRVAGRIFHHQSRFLTDGPGHLAPLRMNQIAEELDLHVSTVSRSVSGKYAETPWGVQALRWFFQSASAGSNSTARGDARDVLREVIEAEDSAEPLSDEALVEEMKRRGHPMARRTVAKYRGELEIPSSYRRRKFS
ncbi:MAG: RNA polymerase sigma-54 factor [Planctomycetota bacterium]|jgi:RNA polymerase sigma-54 factor